MQENVLIQLIKDNFLYLENDYSSSLIEVYYRDNYAEGTLEQFVFKVKKSDAYLSEASSFVKNNINNTDKFIEPFQSWMDIPSWYLEKFSDCPFGVLNSQKINFYLPRVMVLFLEKNNSIYCRGYENWIDYLLPYQKKVRIQDKSFNKLNDIQKAIISVFLCYDYDEKVFDFESEHSYFFNTYWLRYLHEFKDLYPELF